MKQFNTNMHKNFFNDLLLRTVNDRITNCIQSTDIATGLTVDLINPVK